MGRSAQHCPALAGYLLAATARAQGLPDSLPVGPAAIAEGWQGFTEVAFLANALLTLTLAAVLGAVIGYHPRSVAAADTLEKIEAPKVYILYAVIGAIIGIMVLKYGLVVGFVIFGIGGLIRFRTVMRSAGLTGHVIFVTLIGLCCGLDLPHIAVLATAFGFGLVYILELRPTYRVDVKALPSERFAAATDAYRSLLERNECRILSEKKDPLKASVTFIFRSPRGVPRGRLEETLDADIDPAIKGSVDWEAE